MFMLGQIEHWSSDCGALWVSSSLFCMVFNFICCDILVVRGKFCS